MSVHGLNYPGVCHWTVRSVPSAYPVKLSRLSMRPTDGVARNRRWLIPAHIFSIAAPS